MVEVSRTQLSQFLSKPLNFVVLRREIEVISFLSKFQCHKVVFTSRLPVSRSPSPLLLLYDFAVDRNVVALKRAFSSARKILQSFRHAYCPLIDWE